MEEMEIVFIIMWFIGVIGFVTIIGVGLYFEIEYIVFCYKHTKEYERTRIKNW